MDFDKMNKSLKAYYIIEFILSSLVGVIFLLMIIATPIDIYSFLKNPRDYINVYHLDTSEPNWRWEYLKGSILYFGLSILGLILFFQGITKPDNRIFSISKTVVTWVTIFIMIGGYYKWYLTGFDH